MDLFKTKDGSDDEETSFDRNDGIFLIIDNCDNFVKYHKQKFIWNLNYLCNNYPNIVLVFISQDKLQKYFSKQEIKDNKFDFESIEVQRFDFVQSVIYLRQLKLAQDRFTINILKEISNFCEGNPSLLKILGLIV